MSAINLFLEHQKSLNFVAMKYTKCVEDAEDVMQESAIKIWKKNECLNNVKNVRAWMMTVVKNTAIDMYRRKISNKIVYNSTYVFENVNITEEPSDEYFRSVPTNIVNDAIQSLSDSYKCVATMYLLDGLSHKEISDTLGVAIGTSKSNLSKAKKKRNKLYKQEHMKRIILEVFRLMSHRNFIILSIECIKHKILNDALNGEFNPPNGELLRKYHSRYSVLSKKLIFI